MEDRARYIQKSLNKPLVFTGLMGAGKTSIGRLVAEALSVPFFDSDREIERQEGMAVSEIFREKGESYFRRLEKETISGLLSGDIKVIATGGGAVMTEGVQEMIKARAVSIWLKADLDTLVERTARNAKRPLLAKGDPREILGALMEKRYPVYGQADIIIETDAAPPEEMAVRVIEALERFVRDYRPSPRPSP
jgi:shikimate kinase